MTPSTDQMLKRLLATPDGPADDSFVSRTEALVLFEQRRLSLRDAALVRVSLEAVAAGAMLLAFVGAARIGEAAEVVPLSSPATAGLIAIALWCAVSLRPFPRNQAQG